MADTVNPKDFQATTDIDGTEEFPIHETAGWRKATLNTIRTWLSGYFGAKSAEHTHANKTDLDAYNPLSFDPAGAGADAVAAHLMDLDPHTQYIQEAPQDGNIYVRRNGQWEILNIS